MLRLAALSHQRSRLRLLSRSLRLPCLHLHQQYTRGKPVKRTSQHCLRESTVSHGLRLKLILAQMYSGGARPKTPRTTHSSSQSSSMTITTASTHTTPLSGSTKAAKILDTKILCVMDPKEFQKRIDSTWEELECSHRSNLAAVDRLMRPMFEYVQQKHLAAQLATSRQLIDSPERAVQQQ